MGITEDLFVTQEDLYRIGNSTSSRLSAVRPQEVDLIEINGIITIVANGKGVSLYNKAGLNDAPLSGWVYQIKANTNLPIGLKLTNDPRVKGHYFICPLTNMPYHKYVGLLEELAVMCSKLFLKKRA